MDECEDRRQRSEVPTALKQQRSAIVAKGRMREQPTFKVDLSIGIVFGDRAFQRLIAVIALDFVAVFVDSRWIASYDTPLVPGMLDFWL